MSSGLLLGLGLGLVVLGFEALGLAVSRGQLGRLRGVMQRLAAGRGNWLSIDIAMLSLLGLAVLLGGGTGWRYTAAVGPDDPTYTVASAPTGPTLSQKSALITTYENEDFGSTINPLLVEQVLWATDPETTDETLTQGVVVPDPDAHDRQARLLAAGQSGERVVWQSRAEMFHQFPGQYVLYVRVKRGPVRPSQRGEAYGQIEVVQPHTETRLATVGLMTGQLGRAGKWQLVAVPYTQPGLGPAPLVRVVSYGSADLSVESVEVTPRRVVADLEHIADLYPDVPDTGASEGSARYADPGQHLSGTMMFGPYDASVPAGEYWADFRIKVHDNQSREPLVRLQTAHLTEGTDQQTTQEVTLTGADFATAGAYHTFRVPVVAPGVGRLEYRVYWFDRVKTWVDHVQLRHRAPTQTTGVEVVTALEPKISKNDVR